MNRIVVLIAVLLSSLITAQTINYRAEREKFFDLIHTKLKVDFNFQNSTMNGEEWVQLKPHFYPQNQLILDAKGMIIHNVSLKNNILKYSYNGQKLQITLPKTFSKNDILNLYIKYTAQPEKVKQKGSAAITSAKGLYFIDPKDEDPNKPTQIWTQGETEASSCWFPTIDAPNQKTSQEIYITVPNKFITLSNGKLEKQITNPNGTRTDYWNFTQKHAPYLFFMGIGEYEIIKDSYNGKSVDYYVEKKYAPYAKEIFGNTPEMLKYFSKITGVEYPWNKYAQIVGRDYVSGAMENTTAVIHGEQAYQVPGQLIDENSHESTIAHEAFHHWFGDLVTTESWSNLTVNESFANYSEYLWFEHKYGKDFADAHLLERVEGYKIGDHFDKHLVRFNYNNKEDMFDAVSYNKGGAILHMLRNYIGDEAFFLAIENYLTSNKYKTAEAHQWRLALEEVTGKDLNWFFNQWYFGGGHPKLAVSYDFNKVRKEVTVTISQNQTKGFQFPLVIDIFNGSSVIRKNVFVKDKETSFTFPYLSRKKPDLILINADAVLLCEITETKSLSEYIHQLKYAKSYTHKRDALLEIAKHQDDKKAFDAIANAINNPFYKIRKLALENINLSNKNAKSSVINTIKSKITTDSKTLVRAAATETLGKLTDPKFKSIFEKGLQSKSYTVIGKSLVALYYIDKPMAIARSKALPNEVKEIIATPLTRIYINENDDEQLAFIAKNVLSGMYMTADQDQQALYGKAFQKISESNNIKAIINLTDDMVKKGKQFKQYGFDQVGITMMRTMIQVQEKANQPNEQKNIEIIKSAMEKLLQK